MTQRTDLSSFSASAETSEPNLTPSVTIKDEPWKLPAAMAVLIFLNLYCYQRTLNGYFLADDFVHVAYLFDVFNGHPEKLLENFTGNWMHAWGTQFYRPFISLTLAFDYLLGRGNALIFHLSNTLYHCVSSILLFFISRRLWRDFEAKQSFIAALSAAMFFAVCPLHTEVVSWIIGRVDGVCLCFYLSSFLLYLRWKEKPGKLTGSASLFCFALALLSKEMAVTLPPLLVLYELFYSREKELKKRIVNAAKDTAPAWALLALYFGIRSWALGTGTGGYGGSVGEGLSSSFFERFKSAIKIIQPFNAELISEPDRLRKNLYSLYKIGAIFLAARIILLRNYLPQLKSSLFCLLWLLLSLLPTYQVFNITDSLMCSRFAYFATAPICLLLALCLSPLWGQNPKYKLKALCLERISLLITGVFVFQFSQICIKNNSAWAHAGSQLREFRKALSSACQNLQADQKIILLNAPQRMEGAHMLYNGAMLSVLLSEPLSKPAIANRILSFEPPTYGDPDLINIDRLRDLEAKQETEITYWDMSRKLLVKFIPQKAEALNLNFPLQDLNEAIKANAERNSAIVIDSPLLKLPSLAVDFVVCKLSKNNSANGLLTLYWTSENFPSFSAERSLNLPIKPPSEEQLYFFPVSEHKSWLCSNKIERLRLQFPPTYKPAHDDAAGPLTELRIISGEKLIPKLKADTENMAEGLDGIYRPLKDEIELSADASKLEGSSQILLEISKANSWFEHYSGTLRDQKPSKETRLSLSRAGQKVTFKLKRSDFPESAYYELRCFALDKTGKVIGFCSNPLNLQIN
ncbi:MAG: glycosyltransferase family 39 protein [Candidatus Obscuribacterales bacterium]|nr:glycosyltransferase family 39 protein [Candidatus Obscuribacterales bacterium]